MADTKTSKPCRGGDHQGHLCVLHSKGAHDVIARITDKPTVVCFNCGRKANSASSVCNPMPLAER